MTNTSLPLGTNGNMTVGKVITPFGMSVDGTTITISASGVLSSTGGGGGGVTSVIGNTGAVTLAQLQTGGLAPIASPTFSGIVSAPTPTPGTNTTQVATTAFVTTAVASSTAGVSSILGNTGAVTLTQLVTGGVAPLASPTFTGTVNIPTGALIAGYALLASPTFTGTPAVPTAIAGTNTTQIATTAFVTGAGFAPLASPTFTGVVNIPTGAVIAGYATLASPAFTGSPSAPTAAALTNTTQIATTAFVTGAVGTLVTGVSSVLGNTGAVTLASLVTGGVAPLASPTFSGVVNIPTGAIITGYAPLASPTFTGVPAVPTAVGGTNTTQAASTAFVLSTVGTLVTGVSSVAGNTGAVTLVNLVASGVAPLASPTFTGLVTIPGGAINGTTIGSVTTAAGSFTTLSASAAVTFSGIAATSVPVINASNALVAATLGSGLSLSGTTISLVPTSILTTPSNLTGAQTLTQAQNNLTLYSSDTSTVAYTAPQLTAGTQIEVVQGSTGKITWSPGTGVTITCPVAGATGTRIQWASMRFIWLTATSVVVHGDVA